MNMHTSSMHACIQALMSSERLGTLGAARRASFNGWNPVLMKMKFNSEKPTRGVQLAG